MAGLRITIQIAGDRADKDRPRLQNLIEQLEALKKTLLSRRAIRSGRSAWKHLLYRVVALKQKRVPRRSPSNRLRST